MREILVPKLGLDTIDCEINQWLVKVGDTVARGAPLLNVETEKAVIAIEAEVAGTIREIRAQARQTVAVGAAIGLIEEHES